MVIKTKQAQTQGREGGQPVEKCKTGMEVTEKTDLAMQVAKASPSTVHMFGIYSKFELPLLFKNLDEQNKMSEWC